MRRQADGAHRSSPTDKRTVRSWDGSVATWQIVAPAVVSRWITLHTSEAWGAWKKTARTTEHLSDPEILAVIETFRSRTFDGLDLMAIGYQDKEEWHGYGKAFTTWYQSRSRPDVGPGAARRCRAPLLVHAQGSCDEGPVWGRGSSMGLRPPDRRLDAVPAVQLRARPAAHRGAVGAMERQPGEPARARRRAGVRSCSR
jgi:hypothetical protein